MALSHVVLCRTLVRPRPVARSCPALQTDNTDTGAYGWPDGITHPTTATCSAPAHPCPPTLAALWVGAVEVEDVEGHVEDMEAKKDIEEEDEDEVQKNYEVEEQEVEDVEVDVKEYEEVEEDVEEEDEEELEEDEKMEDVDVEELKEEHVGGKAPQDDSDGELDTPPLTGMWCMPGSPPQVPKQLSGMEASLQALVSQLRTELRQQEVASRALAAQLAQEEQRHRHWEKDSAQWVQLQAQENEALRETNTFLEQALAAVVAAGDLGMLARAQEEAQSWQKAAEERGAQLARALAEAAALASRLQDCQVALTPAGQMDTLEDAGVPDEVAAVKEVLRRALEVASDPQDPSPGPQAEGELGTAVGMAMVWATLMGLHSGLVGRGERAEPLLSHSTWPTWLPQHRRRPGRAGRSSRPSNRRWHSCRNSSAGWAGTPCFHHPPPHSGSLPSPPAASLSFGTPYDAQLGSRGTSPWVG